MIVFQDVRKSFSRQPVLNGVSFQILDGEICFVIGKSGSGKSVLLKHMVGLLRPDSGRVQVDNWEVGALGERDLAPLRRACGMIFQFPALLDALTVRQNLLFGLTAAGQKESCEETLHAALASVHLDESVLQKEPSELSLGEQKRVAIARAVLRHPRHLLFDEPTTGLDPVSSAAVHYLIRDLATRLKVTAVVVSHDMEGAIRTADRILLLDQGELVFTGTPSRLKQCRHPVAEAFLEQEDGTDW